LAENRRRILGLIIAGAGLIVLGLVSMVVLSGAFPGTPAAAVMPARVSFKAPSLELAALDGQPASLDELRGQVVLVNIWATWCPPCKEEMPALQEFYIRYRHRGFTIVAINDGETARAVRTFVETYRLSFPVWLDPEYIATEKAFLTMNLPSSFVIDREGTVRLRWVGGVELPVLEKYVTPIIME
jgi:cytochrome c biogenesis protein CcmG/thiol:disulfide interchange protein DsbE